jgi:hypothetical protein
MTSVYELSRSIINRKSVQTFNTAASTLLSRFENDDLEDYERRVRRGNQYRKYMLHVPSLARELFFFGCALRWVVGSHSSRREEYVSFCKRVRILNPRTSSSVRFMYSAVSATINFVCWRRVSGDHGRVEVEMDIHTTCLRVVVLVSKMLRNLCV